MDNVQLDDLVLQNCVKQMDIKSRVSQDLVSRQFASVLHLANASTELSLTMRQDEMISATEISRQLFITISCGAKLAEWKIIVPASIPPIQLPAAQHLYTPNISSNQRPHRSISFVRHKLRKIRRFLSPSTIISMKDEIKTTTHEIRHILLEIFLRFKRFNCFTFVANAAWVRYALDFMLELFSLKRYQPTLVKQLVYKPGGYCDPLTKTFEISQRDCRLVKMLSTSLKKYRLLDGELPREGTDLSKRFWTAISICTRLKTMSLCRLCEAPQLFLNNKELIDYLQSSKISEFHSYGFNDRSLRAEWYIQSFSKNSNLRKLYMNPAFVDINKILATPAILDIIAQLRSVEIAVTTHDFEDSSTIVNIRKIFLALGERSYANVEDLICVNEINQESNDAATVRALAFWIKLSDETQKPIRLYARVSVANKATAISRQAIDDLSKLVEFPGIQIEHFTNRSILQFHHARISVYFKLLTWKPYLTAEYVCKGGHHVG